MRLVYWFIGLVRGWFPGLFFCYSFTTDITEVFFSHKLIGILNAFLKDLMNRLFSTSSCLMVLLSHYIRQLYYGGNRLYHCKEWIFILPQQLAT